jgi:hypothetical protein
MPGKKLVDAKTFEETFPTVTKWIKYYGWIEFGQTDCSRSMVRVLDEGGLIWESTKSYKSVDELLCDLEKRLGKEVKRLGL